MSDDGPAPAGGPPATVAAGAAVGNAPQTNGHDITNQNGVQEKPIITKSHFDPQVSDLGVSLSRPLSRKSSIDLEDYFAGPRDMDGHSKLPYFIRMHGSVMPRMIVPILCIAGWACMITAIHKRVTPLGVSTLLLTVLGFVVGLSLSFRSSTAYERYSEGRKTWCTLLIHSRNLARYIWVHVGEREGRKKEDLLQKITAMNMVLAFAVSVKHRLRFEPYAHYPDLNGLVNHLDTYAKAAHKPVNVEDPKKTIWKAVGERLGLPFAISNPRKRIKRADKPLGNLPMEIQSYLSSYLEEVVATGQMKSTVIQSQYMNALVGLTDTAGNAERVLTTPLPIGYNILISQVVLLYVYLLPFQLLNQLEWLTIPGTIAAAYIILGIATIGDELENPFGNDVNDLPLDGYCSELSKEIDTLMSTPAPKFGEHLDGSTNTNLPLWPLSNKEYGSWKDRSEIDIRAALRSKVIASKGQDIPV
ncbi:Bestrophin, RFP-TM, chloride channel-domain-containing protein [Bisporella sp. PMI_857]|nr:Bestrophin, RFP-TM, chloride channel-domain-containing protein [Bisporella sp. PMI_857]